jgi:hypothetical protein
LKERLVIERRPLLPSVGVGAAMHEEIGNLVVDRSEALLVTR